MAAMEYKVEHPRWQVREALETEFESDVAGRYGQAFQDALGGKPRSAFLAEGSSVTVYNGERLSD